MGASVFRRSSQCSCSKYSTDIVVEHEKSLPNPNPSNFEIIRLESYDGWLVVEILYPNCTNYEGRKLMVFNCTKEDLYNMRTIDSHFCDNSHMSPFARFEPTERGWAAALNCIALMSGHAFRCWR